MVVKKLIDNLWLLFAVMTLVSTTRTAPGAAEEAGAAEPVAVLSIASVDHLMQDLIYLTDAAGRSDVGQHLGSLSDTFLEPFDRSRPAGVLITIRDGEPKGVGFLPVPDVDQLLKRLKSTLGAQVDDLGDGIKKLEMGQGVFLKQQGPWLYFTDHPRHLAQLPSDPVSMLGGLHQKYSIGLRFYASNVPQAQKDVADYLLQTKIDRELQASDLALKDGDAAVLQSLRERLKKWGSTLINQSDQFTIGWAVDRVGQRTYVELNVQAKEASSLSEQMQAVADNRSTFTGFSVDDAAATLEGSLRVSPQGQAQIRSLLAFLRKKSIAGIEADPNAPEAVKVIVTQVLDVVDRTVGEGKTDFGATLLLAPSSFRFVGGLRVADGQALADAFERLFELAKHEPDVPDVHFYAAKHDSLDLHELSLPVPPEDREGRRLLGENVDITIATGPESLYFALGKKSDELLKNVVDRSKQLGPQKVPPLRLRVALRQVMNFLAGIDQDNDKQQMLAETIADAPGGDAIELTVQSVPNGLGLRLEVEQGVLRLIGAVSEQSP